jgi:hypothetical protein
MMSGKYIRWNKQLGKTLLDTAPMRMSKWAFLISLKETSITIEENAQLLQKYSRHVETELQS